MENKMVCIVQARCGSTRLPNKVLKKLTEHKTMLEHLIERLKRSKTIDEIVIATTDQESDNEIEKIAKACSVQCFRGDELNVLKRYYEAASEYNAEIIVRVTSDCPLIHIPLVDSVIKEFLSNDVDYLAPRSSDGLIRGLDVEVFSLKALKKAYIECKESEGLEHVTYYMYRNPNIFKVKSFIFDEELKNNNMRLCVDEELDYIKVKKIYERFYKENEIINTLEVIKWLKDNDEINEINKSVKQKALGE